VTRHERQDQKTVLRCAIYTRVSTEHGLEQEFTRSTISERLRRLISRARLMKAGKADPRSLRHGGFSGGSMERPALTKLLGDVRARRIDVIVVYKVDRLTRSLADFAKLVELFGRA